MRTTRRCNWGAKRTLLLLLNYKNVLHGGLKEVAAPKGERGGCSLLHCWSGTADFKLNRPMGDTERLAFMSRLLSTKSFRTRCMPHDTRQQQLVRCVGNRGSLAVFGL